MALQPIQYLPQPQQFGPAQGLTLGSKIQDIRTKSALLEQQQEAARKAEERMSLYNQEVEKAFTSQDKNTAFARLATMFPEQREAFKTSLGIMNDAQLKNKVNNIGRIYSALQSGNTDLALSMVDEQKAALENSGQDASGMEDIKRSIEANPESGLNMGAIMLSSLMGPKEFADTYGKLEEQKRERELQPGKLEQQGIELGLKKAEVNKVLAQNRKLDAETKKLLLELEAVKQGAEGAIVDPEKRNKAEQALRKEYSKETADFTKTQDAFRKIDAAEDTAVGDLSLIFSFMKMLDPGSVVREGEFATAQNAAGVDEKIINLYNNVITGERLNPRQRESFKKQAQSLMDAASKRDDEVKKTLMNPIKSYGLNPNNVFGVQEETPAEKTPLPTPTVGMERNGFRFKGGNPADPNSWEKM